MISLPLTLGPVDVSKDEFFRSNISFFAKVAVLRLFPLIVFLELISFLLASRTNAWGPVIEGTLISLGSLGGVVALGFVRVRRYYRVSAHKLQGLSWSFGNEGMEIRSEGVQVLHHWQELKRADRVGASLYVSFRMGGAAFIPLRALPAGVDPQELLAELRSRIRAARA